MHAAGGVGTIISGWGPFEMMRLCDALGIEPVFTTNAVGPETPQDMADLIEYLYGGATTTWGKMRIDDGHPEPYETKFFELGCAGRAGCVPGCVPGWACMCASLLVRLVVCVVVLLSSLHHLQQ
jgi:alpha-L-arabinofuranosidase